MDKSSFNLLMSNLAIGLMRGSLSLKPLSTDFQNLGYKIFSIEGTFSLNGPSVIQPEIIATSELSKHTLIGEWTHTVYAENKEAQLQRYFELNTNLLSTSLAVPRKAAEGHSIWFVVHKESKVIFDKFLREKFSTELEDRLLLSCFEMLDDGSYKLGYCAGKMQNSASTKLLSSDYLFKKIPLGYLRASTSDLGIKSICDVVITTFVSKTIANGDQDIHCSAVAKEIFEVWNFFDNRMQSQIIEAIDRVLKQFSQKHGKKFVQRGSTIKSWKIIGERLDGTRLRSLRAAVDKFRHEVENDFSQLSIYSEDGSFVAETNQNN